MNISQSLFGLVGACAVIVSSVALAGARASGPVPLRTAEATTLTYADVKPILETNCESCHLSGSFLPLTSLEDVKASKDAMLARIEEGTMPPGEPTFKDTTDGAKLVEWLKSGSDL